MQIIASRQNRHQKEEDAHRDIGVGNGTKPPVILKILDSGIYSLYATNFETN